MKKLTDYRGFTLLEMLIVMFVISLLLLLFIPNLSGKKDGLAGKGDEAFTKVIQTQVELYTLEKNTRPNSLDDLLGSKYINDKQYERAQKLGIRVD